MTRKSPDIVERLRSVSGCTQKTFMHRLDWEDGRKIINEAAAEIERLRGVAQTPADTHPHYSASIAWSEEDRAYIGTIPELPGCCADGATPDECIRELKDAKAAWIGACEAAGNPVPEPRPFAVSHSSTDREGK